MKEDKSARILHICFVLFLIVFAIRGCKINDKLEVENTQLEHQITNLYEALEIYYDDIENAVYFALQEKLAEKGEGE